jgi:uncharacterized membrane protein YfcA
VTAFGAGLALVVGLVLGLLGGGGSILAVPIFLYVFRVPAKPAIAMSLVVVGMSALVGFLTHWRQGTVNVRVAATFGAFAMAGAFGGARVARSVPESVQLSLFAAFALTAAVLMLRDSARAPKPAPAARVADAAGKVPRFSALLGAQAVAVGALTALIGAGGGFLIVPALVLVAHLPVREAVGSSLLIIAMNATSGVAGYLGQVAFDWRLVGWFTSVAAVGTVAGTRLMQRLPAARIKQAFAIMILVLGTYLVIRRLLQ